jgi:hypothetical protein
VYARFGQNVSVSFFIKLTTLQQGHSYGWHQNKLFIWLFLALLGLFTNMQCGYHSLEISNDSAQERPHSNCLLKILAKRGK